MEDIIVSQEMMKKRMDPGREISYNLSLMNAFHKQIEKAESWAEDAPHVDWMTVNYEEVLQNPLLQMERVNAFINNKAHMDKMQEVIDENLNRSGKKVT